MKDRVVFYGENDLANGILLRQAETVINQFDLTKVYDDINDVLELYSIKQFFDAEIYLTAWSDEQIALYKRIVCSFAKPINCFLAGINNDNLEEMISSLDFRYKDTFLRAFSHYKVYNRVSDEKSFHFLSTKAVSLGQLLKHKELVNHYGVFLAEYMRNAAGTGNILVNKYLQADSPTYFIPKELKPSEYEGIIQKAIDSDHILTKNLELIYQSNSTAECPISDKLRLSAKRAYDKKIADLTADGFGFSQSVGVGINENENEEIILVKTKHGKDYSFYVSYDQRWLEENLDYPTILNNFIYVFEMVDLCWRCKLVSIKNKVSPIEKAFSTNGVRNYLIGQDFDFKHNLSLLQIISYTRFLLRHEIRLEEVFQWFFHEYLPDEFSVEGFMLNIPSKDTAPSEKCRTIADEMDGVLKQFRMFVQDGKIDPELYAMSSEHMKVDAIPSMITNKYAYASSQTVEREQFLLFSDQSLLTHRLNTEKEHSSFYSMLQTEDVFLCEFSEMNRQLIDFLVKQHSVTITDRGRITMNIERIAILKELYENEVICPNYHKKYRSVIDEMISGGELKVENQLFSRPEQDYLNYFLNKAKFSNGYDLRNKYAHSTYPRDVQKQWIDYYMLLRIMVIVVIKINEEFVLNAKAVG